MAKVVFHGFLCLLFSGCGESAAQRWSDLPTEEKQRRLMENLERGEIHVAPLEGELQSVESLPPGTAYRAFGELRFKDPTYSMLGAAIVRLYELQGEKKEVMRDQTTECNLEEVQPGFYQFVATMEPIAKRGRYSIRIKGIGDPLAVGDFLVK